MRYLGELAGVDDPYDLATKAGLARETVRGWWYGSSVPDGIGLLELLRAAGIVDDAYRLPGVSRAAELDAAAGEIQAAEDRAARLAGQQSPARRRRKSA